MRRWLFILSLAVFPTASLGLALQGMEASQLRHYSAMLGEHAGTSQWQRLWQTTRQRGYFAMEGKQPRFVLPMRELPAAARQTLNAPDHLEIASGAQMHLRRDFSPSVIGTAEGRPLHGLCLTVDWSDAPDLRPGQAWSPADLFHVTLRLAEPC